MIRLFVSESSSYGPTVDFIVRQYLDHLHRRLDAGDYSHDALSNIDRELTSFAAAHPLAVGDCRQHDLTAWLECNPSWESAHTKKRIVAGLIACFRWALEEELIDRCPYRRVKAVSNLPYEARRPADPAEYVALMRAGSRALRRALFFLRRTGARTCEMRELRWGDCFLDGDCPHICLTKHKTMKGGKVRKIGLDAGTAAFLRAMKRTAMGEVVFLNCEGGPWSRRVFARHLRRLAQRIGLDERVERRITAYSLRHSYTVDAIEGGMSTRAIADQLGHESTDMIDHIYGSHTRQRQEHLANVAKNVLRNRIRK